MVFNEKDIHDLLFDAPRKVGSVNVRSLVKDLMDRSLVTFWGCETRDVCFTFFSFSESFANFRCICPNIRLHEGTSWKRLSLPALQILKVWFFAASSKIFKLIQNCGKTNIFTKFFQNKNHNQSLLYIYMEPFFFWGGSNLMQKILSYFGSGAFPVNFDHSCYIGILRSPTWGLRETQHTLGAYPRPPQTPKWKEFHHKRLVLGLGYVPGVCWKILRLGGLSKGSLLGGSSHFGKCNHGDRKSPNWGCGTPAKWPFDG